MEVQKLIGEVAKRSAPLKRTLHTTVRRAGPPLPQAPMGHTRCLDKVRALQGNALHPPPLVL